MANIIEYDRYSIAGHFLPAIINGDYSGLSDTDEYELDAFLKTVPSGTWECSNDTEFARDIVSGLMADCYQVTLWTNAGAI